MISEASSDKLDKQVADKIVQLLLSGNKEMCNLAITMFCGLTNNYSDYFTIRTAYQPNTLHVANENAKAAFNQMFNHLDRETIMKQFNRKVKELRRTSLNSKQKRKQFKEEFKKKSYAQK